MNRLTVSPGWGPPCPPCRSGVEGQAQFRFFARPFCEWVRWFRRTTYRVGLSAFRPTKMVPTSGAPG
jgi:hypothetical protein